MFDGRTLHSREVMERLVQAWGDTVFHTVIRRTVKFSDSTVAGEPITTYASTSTGADAYRQLAKEVLARWPDSPTVSLPAADDLFRPTDPSAEELAAEAHVRAVPDTPVEADVTADDDRRRGADPAAGSSTTRR